MHLKDRFNQWKQPIIKAAFFVLIAASSARVYGNNLQLSALSLVNADTAANQIHLKFDISWNNSWRLSTAPSNHDAVWVFMKYRVGSTGNWMHVTLNGSGHVLPTGCAGTVPADNKGIFIYRSANGTGNVNFSNVFIRWNYGADGLTEMDSVQVRVYGVEMVYIPQGSYYAGDGETRAAHLYGNFENGTSGNALQITSEGSLTLGGGGSGSLGNNNRSGHYANPGCDGTGCLTGSGDDFNDATSATLPAAFPKGYQAFYCMKYEVTQQQIADMFNTATSQQLNVLASTTHFYPSLFQATQLRYDISNSGGTYTTSLPHVPYIYADWIRAAAYADWSALRPMTELEFEKACRGTLSPQVAEYPWGNNAIDLSANLSVNNAGAANEGIATGYDTAGAEGNCWINDGTNHTMPTVARVGIFAAHPSNTGRVTSGSTYYGVMEMGGNAWERCISVGHSEGRKFNGTHGDGVLNVNGYANVADWPGTYSSGVVDSNMGMGYRGGGLAWPTPDTERNARVSSRILASAYYNVTIHDDGFRLVRTAQ